MPGQVGRSGGARVGAGRPRKSDGEKWLSGNGGKRRDQKPDVVALPDEVPVPEWLSEGERAIWKTWAPCARAERTLTAGTAGDFAVLCQLEVEMAEALAERRKEGWTSRGMFLAKEFRGLVQRVEAKRRAFRLAPMGKPLEAIEQPKDEWAEFDGGQVQ